MLLWEKNKLIMKEMHADKCFWYEYLYNEKKKIESAHRD